MKPWRSKNWDVVEIAKRVFGEDTNEICQEYQELIEAGADAMLEALFESEGIIDVEDGSITMPGFLTYADDYIRSMGKGTWVFIPEDKIQNATQTSSDK